MLKKSAIFLKNILEEAEQLLIKAELNNITQLELDQMSERLHNAIKGLVKIEDNNIPGNSELPGIPESEQDELDDSISNGNVNLPVTGVSNYIVWLSRVFFIVGLVVLVQGKKRRKNNKGAYDKL